MATQTSKLIVSLIDNVSGPARAAARGILGIPQAMARVNGKPMDFAARIGVAIERNNAALDAARGHLFDAAAGFYALRTALAAPLRDGMAFETVLSGIGSKADLSAAQLREVGTAARRAATASNQMGQDVLGAVDYLVGMGLSANDAMTSIETIGKAATATGAQIRELSQAGYAAMANLKVPADQVGLALDFMAQAGKRGGFELKDMAQYFPAVGAAYQALGQEGVGAVADLAAAMQVMRMDTGDASSAATNLQNVLQKMMSPATERKFAAMGINLREELKAAAEAGLTPLEAIATITEKATGGDLSRLGYLFEDAQAQAGIRSMIQHLEKFREIREQALSGAGTNQKDFDRAMRTTEQRLKRARVAMANLSAVIGTALLPIITALTDAITPVAEAFAQWADQNPRLVGTIVAVTAAAVGLRVAMSALSYLGLLGRGGVLGTLAVGARALGSTVGALWGAAKASAALQAALAGMDGAKIGLFGRIAAGLRGIAGVTGISAATSAIGGLIAVLGTISAPAWVAIGAAVAAVGLAWKYWDRVSAFIAGAGEALGEILAPALEAARPVLDWFAPLGEAISSGWNAAGEAIRKVGEWLSSFFTQETLTEEDKAAAKQAGHDFIMAIWDGMKSVATGMLEWVSGIAASMTAPFRQAGAAVREFFDPPATAPTNWRGKTPARLPGRAGGGRVSAGGTYLVGERQAEVFRPSTSGSILPEVPTGGGPQITVAPVFHFTGVGGGDAAEIARQVREVLDREVRSLFSGVYADAGLRPSGG